MASPRSSLSSSPTVDPNQRPASGVAPPTSSSPSSPPSPSVPRPPSKAFKSYGQGYQYAESWQNPLPEFIVSSGYTHPVQVGVSPSGTGEGTSGDGTCETRTSMANTAHDLDSSHRPETVGSKKSDMQRHDYQEAVWVEPEEAPWYKKITKLQWLIFTVCFLGITAVLLAILGAMGVFTGSTSEAATSGAASSTSITSGSSSTSSSISPKPTGTRIACDDASTYFKSVAWAGADGGSGFNADFGMAAKSEEDCCVACRDSDKSCAGWVFEANNTFTPCTRLLLKDNNPNKDDKCPQGKVASTTFEDGGEMVAGLGPCSGKAIG